MSERLRTYIETATGQTPSEKTVGDRFLARAKEGLLTKDENPETHFCVYFAGYDPKAKKSLSAII